MKSKYLVILILLVNVGCKKMFFGDDPENTPVNNFEIFWKDFDRNYAQFNIKHIDWDSVYSVNMPLISSNPTDNELYTLLSGLIYKINDMHVNLYTPYGSIYWRNPGFGKYPSGRFINLCKYLACGSSKTTPVFEYGQIKNENIGYIIVFLFGGEGDGLNLADTRYDFIDAILTELKNTDGIIIDVRANPGGELFNAQTVASRFADKRRLYSKYCAKNGPGKNDFSDWKNLYIEPAGAFQYFKPVVVITSRNTCSAAENFVLAMKTFPQVRTVGDTTGGGFGLPMYRELPNGWSYRLSTMIGATADNFIIEGVGIAPDITVQTSAVDSARGYDRLIEKSIEVIIKTVK